jgi:hypothetical protein
MMIPSMILAQHNDQAGYQAPPYATVSLLAAMQHVRVRASEDVDAAMLCRSQL